MINFDALLLYSWLSCNGNILLLNLECFWLSWNNVKRSIFICVAHWRNNQGTTAYGTNSKKTSSTLFICIEWHIQPKSDQMSKNLVPRCRLWDSMQGEKYFSFISDEFLCRGSCSVSKVKTCIILQNKCWLLTASVALQMFSVTWKDFIEQGRCSLFAKSYFSLIECNNVGTK